MRKPPILLAMIAAVWLREHPLEAQGVELYEQPPVSYSTAQPHDAVVALQALMASGQVKWTGDGKETVMRLLKELHIPVESQMLVFSKTSFQRHIIGPSRPRAIYFSDTCYVGWVPGGLVEVAAIDPTLGPIFYRFDPNETEPRFVRDSECMTCHGGVFVRGIPGVFTRSLFTDDTGEPLFQFGSTVVDFRTPFADRWGGWYVTGRHGRALHRGNTIAQSKDDQLIVHFERGANTTNLSRFFQTQAYLRPDSDIVALLVLEHQTAMQNTLTRASLDCRRMLAYQKNLQTELKETVTDEPTYDSVKHVFEGAAQAVVDDLLFKEEAPLPEGLQGSGAFQAAFSRESPRCEDGSSLREFQLEGHLFKNRCSYLIYSGFFLELPGPLKKQVYARLAQALSLTDPDPRYAYLSVQERARISKILRQTHPELRSVLVR